MRKLTFKTLALSLVGVLVVAGAAIAYWTQSGSGSGTVSSGTTTPITVNQSTTITNLAPGVAAQTLSGTFDNPNSGPVYVASVTATVASTDKTGCGPTDYTIGGTANVNAEVAAGNGVGTWSGLTIAFNDKTGVNQNACKGATVTLSYTSN